MTLQYFQILHSQIKLTYLSFVPTKHKINLTYNYFTLHTKVLDSFDFIVHLNSLNNKQPDRFDCKIYEITCFKFSILQMLGTFSGQNGQQLLGINYVYDTKHLIIY